MSETMQIVLFWVTIGTSLLTMAALGVVCYQTWLTRGAVIAAKRSIVDDARTRHLQNLPTAGTVIATRVHLEKWSTSLLEVETALRRAAAQRDVKVLNEVASLAPKAPSDVMPRWPTESLPRSFKTLLLAGGQYFYHVACNFRSLVTPEPDFRLAESLASEASWVRPRIDELVALLKDLLPAALEESPASIPDSRFMADA